MPESGKIPAECGLDYVQPINADPTRKTTDILLMQLELLKAGQKSR